MQNVLISVKQGSQIIYDVLVFLVKEPKVGDILNLSLNGSYLTLRVCEICSRSKNINIFERLKIIAEKM